MLRRTAVAVEIPPLAVEQPPAVAPSEMREVDRVFSDIVQTFVNCMSEEKGMEKHIQLAHQFNAKLDSFFEGHPEASLANIASGLAKLRIPYEQALSDIVYVRTLGHGDE
jgi:hypothetical protein